MRDSTPKDNQIRWMNSLTNTSNLLANKDLDNSELKEKIVDLANFIYNIEPRLTELEESIEECKTVDELEPLKEEVVKTDSVKMFNTWNDKKIKLS